MRPSTNYKRVFLNEAVQPPIESNPENHGFNHTSPEPFSESTSLPSPFHLTTIQGLPAFENQDTVGIEDILGEVMLREVWLFNYMHDIHWVMKQFDDDIRAHVKVVFVHGNWKREDRGRRQMEVCGVRSIASILR